MRVDFTSSNFVGKGEDTAVLILSHMFNLEKHYQNWEKHFHDMDDGIYTQIQIPWLLKSEFLNKLAQYHDKSSVDIVIILNKKRVCIRVQGKSHFGTGPKPLRDKTQKWMLEQSGNIVIDFNYYDMPNLFQDKVDEKSIKEVKDILNMSKEWVTLIKKRGM